MLTTASQHHKRQFLTHQTIEKTGMYTSEISRSNPTAFIFLIDQSGSMSDQMSSGRTKAQQVADVLNRTLASLVIRCTKSEGIRSYFDVGVIGYGANGIYNGFQGELSSSIIHPISEIEACPLRIEERQKKMDDGAGGIITQSIKFPVWFEPYANGGTPMCEALTKAAEEIVTWCDSHPNNYPPTILHVTDGESTDGNPEQIAESIQQIHTNDGAVLMFNLHITNSGAYPIEFPSDEEILPDDYAKLLFRMSSSLPGHLIPYAQEKGFKVNEQSRGFMLNADAIQIVDFFDIGTRASQLR